MFSDIAMQSLHIPSQRLADKKGCLAGQRARERSGMHEHVLNHMLIAFNMQTAAKYMDRAIESDQRLWAGQEPSSRPGQ